MKEEFDKLLQKKMDRKAFLKHVGIGFIAMTGIATLLKTLNGNSSKESSQAVGYGGGAYGGNSRSSNKS